MTFLAPIFLWSLLALLPLTAIYFLKVRPRSKFTPAYFLWEKIFSEKRATSLFNRLRDLLSLLLMLIAFAFLALALSRPEFGDKERKDVLLLVDHSASMGATDGSTTRLHRARSAARDIVIALDGNQRAAIASASHALDFRSHLSVSPRELTKAIDSIEQTNHSFNISPIRSLAQDANWSDNYRIILISDGAFAGADSLPENVDIMRVGKDADNMGIVAADLERLPDGRLGFFYQVASTLSEERTVDLLLHSETNGQVAKVIPLQIASGLNKAETFFLEDGSHGKWIAELDIEDDFAADNRAWMTVQEPRSVRVQVNTENRFFFETSVLAFEQGGELLQLVDADPDIVIHQGATLVNDELSIIFTPAGESNWWKSIGEEEDAVAPREIIDNHPILRHIDLPSLAFIGAKKIEPIEGSLVLVESENGNPLVYKAKHGDNTALVVNMDPVLSDFYFSAWFPVLVHGAASHLAARETSLAPVYRPGDSIPIPGHRPDTESSLLLPNGETATTTDPETNNTELLGFLDFTNESGNWPAAVTLLSKADSLLNKFERDDSSLTIATGHSISYWLIVAAIVIFTIESILYHRRKVG